MCITNRTLNLYYFVLFHVDTSETPIAYRSAHFGQGTGPIFLSAVACTGMESFLLNCSVIATQGLHSCTHEMDAGVGCPSKCSYFTMGSCRLCTTNWSIVVSGSLGQQDSFCYIVID